MINFNSLEDLEELKCGFYNISHDKYLSLDAINNSAVSNKIKYPHGHITMDSSSEAFKLGTAFHELILFNDTFNTRYHVMESTDKRTKKYKEEIENVPEGKIIISQSEYDNLLFMKKVIDQSEAAKRLLDTEYKEITAIFEWKGKKCKCKIDALKFKNGHAIISDLKTTASLEPYMIRKSCRDYGYDRQAAFYIHGVMTLLDMPTKFVNIFVDKPSDAKRTIGCLCASFKEEAILSSEAKIDITISEWDKFKLIVDLEMNTYE